MADEALEDFDHKKAVLMEGANGLITKLQRLPGVIEKLNVDQMEQMGQLIAQLDDWMKSIVLTEASPEIGTVIT